MIIAALLTALAATCPGQGSTCPAVCYECGAAPDPVDGTDPTLAEWRELFDDISQRNGASDLPTIGNLENGAARTRTAAEFPCRLLPAIAATEAGMRQFCADSGLTIISFDCGYGVMQVTSGAAGYPGLEARADINVAAGANILVSKWNGEDVYGGTFGESDPLILESWYFAVWAYNGFVYSNNPNNPDFDPSRAPYRSAGGLSRGSYPYQEIVWGYLRNPLQKDGEEVVEAVEISYPTNVPDQSGLFSVDLALPTPSHADPCVEVCPPTGCPAAADRTVILDDADTGFSIEGAFAEIDEGGYLDRFLSVPSAPAGQPDVVARFTAIAPASGTFRVGGWVPLSPADSERVPVVVHARGEPRTFALDQSVAGGFFAPLGEVVLLAGEPFVVVVQNDTGEAGDVHLGIDAFRLTWAGDGAVASGDACATDTDCAGDLLCTGSVCAEGCEAAGCAGGAACDAATGRCGEPPLVVDAGTTPGDDDAGTTPVRDDAGGSAEDDGGGGDEGDESDGGVPPRSIVGACACDAAGASGHGVPAGTAVLLVATALLRRRRR